MFSCNANEATIIPYHRNDLDSSLLKCRFFEKKTVQSTKRRGNGELKLRRECLSQSSERDLTFFRCPTSDEQKQIQVSYWFEQKENKNNMPTDTIDSIAIISCENVSFSRIFRLLSIVEWDTKLNSNSRIISKTHQPCTCVCVCARETVRSAAN